jgi:hypothetical protein
MLNNNWSSCILDDNVFFRYSKTNRIMFVATYVDDILCAYHPADKQEFMEFVKLINKKFALKEIGEPESILGMKLHYDKSRKTITLSHSKYIEGMLKTYGLENCKSCPTPATEELLGPQHCPTMNSEKSAMKKFPYRNLIGELLYLAHSSRPDISYSVGVLSRFMENPGRRHWEAAKRVLRYLKGSIDLGLTYNGDLDSNTENGIYNIEAYSDADWGRDLHGRKSIFGYVIHLNGCPISWISKKQTFVSQSTCESEYVGMSEAVREIRWIYQLLQELKINSEFIQIPTLYGDNISSIKIASNSRMDNRIKSIDIKYHYIKDEEASKHVQLQHVASEYNIADIFTKPLGATKFHNFKDQILGEI